MSRSIYDVVVNKISLLWWERSPAVPHADRNFMILKAKNAGISLSEDQKNRLVEVRKKIASKK